MKNKILFSLLFVFMFSFSFTASAYNFGTTTLKNGSKGEAVMELQRFLNATLNLGLVVDGKLGPKTILILKKWQNDHKLKADGLIGPTTKLLMNSSVGLVNDAQKQPVRVKNESYFGVRMIINEGHNDLGDGVLEIKGASYDNPANVVVGDRETVWLEYGKNNQLNNTTEKLEYFYFPNTHKVLPPNDGRLYLSYDPGYDVLNGQYETTLVGLDKDTVYTIRPVVQKNNGKPVYGNILYMRTAKEGEAQVKDIETLGVNSISENNLTGKLQAELSGESSTDNANLWFVYGKNPYSFRYQTSSVNFHNDLVKLADGLYTRIAKDLESNTTYYYAACAASENYQPMKRITSCGKVLSFKTQ